MGDGADMALENAFDDFEEYCRYEQGEMTYQEAYECGILDEMGTEYPGVKTPVVALPRFESASTSKTYKNQRGHRGEGPCPACGRKTVLKVGRHGHFYGCENFPRCYGSRSA